MPRKKTQTDERLLDGALELLSTGGPEALTFSALSGATGLSQATLVQRFGSKARLKQAALLRAWDVLSERTDTAARQARKSPQGAVDLLVMLSKDYGEIEAYAEGLLLLREDLRDPLLRERGAQWHVQLTAALGDCFADDDFGSLDVPHLLVCQWQGCLLWWSFDPREKVEDYVAAALRTVVAAVVSKAGS